LLAGNQVLEMIATAAKIKSPLAITVSNSHRRE
jgi:hypothetical protein